MVHFILKKGLHVLMADYEGFREWLYVESEISIDKQNVNHILVEANCSCFIW